jgi:hypothetical protein
LFEKKIFSELKILLCTNQGRPSVNKVPLGVTILGQKLAQDMPLMKRGSCAKVG